MLFRMFCLLFVVIVVSGCTAARTERSLDDHPEEPQRYDLHVQFASDEDVKRVPVQVPSLRMELKKEISASDRLYLVSVQCRAAHIERVVQKLNETEGVLRAERVTF